MDYNHHEGVSFVCFFRYLYYFLKSENAHKKELCNVLEGLLSVDPTSELNEEYTKLATHEAGECTLYIA